MTPVSQWLPIKELAAKVQAGELKAVDLVEQALKTIENKKAIKASMMASHKNCLINDAFSAPKTFLTPISTARLDDRAVERFIKFTQAINKVTNAMAIKI